MTGTRWFASPSAALLRQVVSYGAIGVASASLDTLVFWILTQYAGVAPHLANVVGISCGITMSFGLNRMFTFAVLDRTATRFATFVMVGLFGMGISVLMIEGGIRLQMPLMQVKVASVVVVALVQFTLNRTITFRSARD